MSRAHLALLTAVLATVAVPLQAQTPAAPPFATTQVEGTNNVYIFRYGFHQSMFIVTPQGVIATDPIGYLRPEAVTSYIDEIRKITQAPIRYVIYSHHHYDHIAGGQPFKDAGARFIAHKNARDRLQKMRPPNIVIPDEALENKKTITLGGTTLELIYVGRNHSDNSLVMRLPREKLIFTVDFIPLESIHFRNMPDSWPIEWEESLRKVLALDWERMLTGHPYKGKYGTKQDVQNLLTYMQELSAEVKKAAEANRCTDAAMKEIKMPKYETWLSYSQSLSGNIERYCYWWGRGY